MDYSVKIDEFEGPLDLLLHLIKKSNIDIYDISIDVISKQYLDYLHQQQKLNINIASSYLVMASELMEIKSKSLLPSSNVEEETEDEEVSRDNLIKKLVEYQKYQEVTKELNRLELNRKNIFVKSPEKSENYLDDNLSNEYDIADLTKAFLGYLERKKEEKPLNTKIAKKEYDIKKRKKDIKDLLITKKRIYFDEMFDVNTNDYLIVTFIAILEMVKDHDIRISQDNNFSRILVELKEGCL